MFSVVLAIEGVWKQSQCPLTEEYFNKLCYPYSRMPCILRPNRVDHLYSYGTISEI